MSMQYDASPMPNAAVSPATKDAARAKESSDQSSKRQSNERTDTHHGLHFRRRQN
jgi:hypothetical protein